MKILGIDYGEAKIGLATTDGELAQPLGLIKRENGEKHIAHLCQEQGIEKIVLGVSEGTMAEKTKEFGKALRKMTLLPVELWEESLTSQLARKKMIEAKKAILKRKNDEHLFAAALILQDYLNNLPHE